MNTRILGCAKKMGVAFQRRPFSLYTVPRAITLLPSLGVLQLNRFGPSRPLSSASKLFEKFGNSSAEWMTGGVPDLDKWNKRMDELAERSNTDPSVIEEWANLLEDGVAAKLPDIEITLMRHREISPNLDAYMDAVLAADDEFDDDGAEYDLEEGEEDEEEDESEDEFDEDEDEDEEDESEILERVGENEEQELEKVSLEELERERKREQGINEKPNQRGRKT